MSQEQEPQTHPTLRTILNEDDYEEGYIHGLMDGKENLLSDLIQVLVDKPLYCPECDGIIGTSKETCSICYIREYLL